MVPIDKSFTGIGTLPSGEISGWRKNFFIGKHPPCLKILVTVLQMTYIYIFVYYIHILLDLLLQSANLENFMPKSYVAVSIALPFTNLLSFRA